MEKEKQRSKSENQAIQKADHREFSNGGFVFRVAEHGQRVSRLKSALLR